MTANKVLTNADPIISLHVEKSTGIYKRHLLTGVHVYRQPGLDPHNLSVEFSMFQWGIASYLVRDHWLFWILEHISWEIANIHFKVLLKT